MADWSTLPGSARLEAPFDRPAIDRDELRDAPLPHRYLHGAFEGTGARFSFYFPPKESYEGRFYHYLSPMPFPETALQEGKGAGDLISFAIHSGAFIVESNQGGFPIPGDVLLATNIAVAKLAKAVAQDIYGAHRTHGYVFGGSGGGFKTMSCVENSEGVWAGSVPFVIGTPISIPCNFTVRAHALRILKDRFPQIVDAVDPGSGKDMYDGLAVEERDALGEATRLGFPPEVWSMRDLAGYGALPVLAPSVGQMDPTYYADFWTKPGYLGSDPNGSAARARVQLRTRITEVIRPKPKASANAASSGVDEAWKSLEAFDGAKTGFGLRLAAVPKPDADLVGSYILFATGAATGKRLPYGSIAGDLYTPGTSFDKGEGMSFLDGIQAGDEVVIDNSDFLALQTFHRHQLPPFGEYPVYDALFREADGTPKYPQRPMLVGPIVCAGGAGSLQSGKHDGKMIVVAARMDESALPWNADWYRQLVAKVHGPDYEDSFRLWYHDHAVHGDDGKPVEPRRLVTYMGALQQALRDVAAWAERGVEPPASTRYEIVGGQVACPREAYLRKGVQPTVLLTANGGERAEVAVGEPVRLRAELEAPPHAGGLVDAAWDFEGEGAYADAATLVLSGAGDARATVEATHAFAKPGTYFAALRATAKRHGTAPDPFCRVDELARVRVVVKA